MRGRKKDDMSVHFATNQHETKEKERKKTKNTQIILPTFNMWSKFKNIFCSVLHFKMWQQNHRPFKSDSIIFCFFSDNTSTVIVFFPLYKLAVQTLHQVRHMSFHLSPYQPNSVPSFRDKSKPLWRWTKLQRFCPEARNRSHMNQVEKPLFNSKMLDLGYIWLNSAQSIYFT